MERDKRLTGVFRGQTDNAQAPRGFELNNPWKVGSISPNKANVRPNDAFINHV